MTSEPRNIENHLDVILSLFQKAEDETNNFEIEFSGKKHPETIKNLGKGITLLYKAACCFWKCNGGDHLIERLVAKAVNQAICSFKLYKGCFYDESLMITRGIGEIVNLLYVFQNFPEKREEWKTLDSKNRFKNFSPSAARKILEKAGKFVPIDKTRYSKLCEIGTHPSPSEVPGHYSGTGIPILGMIVQPAGAYVSITELSFAIGLLCVVTPELIEVDDNVSKDFHDLGISLIKNLGAFHILNYSELLAEAITNREEPK